MNRQAGMKMALQDIARETGGLSTSQERRRRRARGKGKTERSVFLSADARTAPADYLDRERSRDATPTATALFLSAPGIPVRAADGRLSPRAINLILDQRGDL